MSNTVGTVNPGISIVVSAFNEEESIPKYYEAVSRLYTPGASDHEIIFVNDGSTDNTLEEIKKIAASDPSVKAISFSRNYGHESAMIAGIDYAGGDFIVCMDADLQNPVEKLPEMLQAYEDGADVVNMVRNSNTDAGIIKKITSKAFYAVINVLSDANIEPNASDFFGISRRVADILRNDYREKIRFLRGYVQNVGFKKVNLTYDAGKRVAGESKYSIRKLFKFSFNTIMCFSDAPLKAGIYAGIIAIILGIAMTIYTIISWARVGTPSGYATIIVLICFMFAILFFILGVMGAYISVIFTEIKDRPIYLIQEKINL